MRALIPGGRVRSHIEREWIKKGFVQGDIYSYEFRKYIPEDANVLVVGKISTSTPSGKSDRHMDGYFMSFLRERGLHANVSWRDEGLRAPEPDNAHDAYFPAVCDPYLAYIQLRKYVDWPVELDWDLFWEINDLMIEFYKLYIPATVLVSLRSVVEYLDLRKSPGRLWRRYGDDKLDVLEDAEGLELLLADYMSFVEHGENVSCFHSGTLKSELRSKEKVFSNPPSTRLFLGSDFLNLITSHTYSLDFNVKFCEKALIMDHAVGPGKFYGNTDKMFRALMKFAAVMSYDSVKWDGHFYACEMEANYIIRYHCMAPEFKTPETRQCLSNLSYANSNGYIVMPDGVIVQNITGIKNPSGQGNTTQDNTMTHQRRFYMFWFSAAPAELRSMRAMVENTVRLFYSDDGIISVSSDVLSWCNILTYAQWSKGNGWALEHGPMRSAMESEFLGTTPAFFGPTIVPRLPFSRCFCGLLKAAPSPVSTPLYSFERACAYRIENYFDPEFRTMVEEYIAWLIQNYGISMTEAGMYLSQAEICRLYGLPPDAYVTIGFPHTHWVHKVKHIPSEIECAKNATNKQKTKHFEWNQHSCDPCGPACYPSRNQG